MTIPEPKVIPQTTPCLYSRIEGYILASMNGSNINNREAYNAILQEHFRWETVIVTSKDLLKRVQEENSTQPQNPSELMETPDV